MKTAEDAIEEIENMCSSVEAFKKKHTEELQAVTDHVVQLEARLNRPPLGDSGDGSLPGASPATKPVGKGVEHWRDTKSGRMVPLLGADHRFTDLHDRKAGDSPMPIGRMLRGMVLGHRADDHRQLAEEMKASAIGMAAGGGGYTAIGVTAAQWVDQIRSAMVLQRAGCRSMPMDSGEVQIARLIEDPAVNWHSEHDSLPDSQPTFGSTRLIARTVTCLLKFSLELARDSENIDSILGQTMINAVASAIDAAGLAGSGATNAAAAPYGLFELDGRGVVPSVGAPTNWDWLVDGMYELAVDNMPIGEIGAMIAHPAVWRKMRKLKSGVSGDNTPLTMPDEVANLPKLWTTAAPLSGGTTAKAIVGRWSDLLMGVRQEITFVPLAERYIADRLQFACLAYARVGFAAVRPESFCTMEGITV